MAANRHRVPQKQWRKWTPRAQGVFNALYKWLMDSRDMSIVQHPKAAKMKPAECKTLAWNVSWLAADAVDEQLPDAVAA